MLEFVAELGDLPRDHTVRINYVLDRLCPLLGARRAIWFSTTWDENDIPHVTGMIDRGWSTAHERDMYYRYVNSDLRQDPLYAPSAQWKQTARPYALLNWREHYTDAQWYGSPFVQDYLRPTGLGHPMVLVKKTARPGVHAGISVFREWSDANFDSREMQLFDLVVTACNGLLDGFEEPRPHLAPRAKQVLARMLEGDSAKQIARHLGISIHTTNDHIQSIYRIYGVASRGELLARFLRA